MNKRLYRFLIAEIVLILLIVLSVVLKYQMLTQILLIVSPTFLIGFAVYHHIYNGEKTPHKIMLSILVYIVIALNLFALIDPNLEWKGILTSPLWVDNGTAFNDEGVMQGIYIISLFSTCILIGLYELILLMKHMFKKK